MFLAANFKIISKDDRGSWVFIISLNDFLSVFFFVDIILVGDGDERGCCGMDSKVKIATDVSVFTFNNL